LETIRIETIVEQDGCINVPGVHAGDAVEVTVVRKLLAAKTYPLRGLGARYLHPFEPAIPLSD